MTRTLDEEVARLFFGWERWSWNMPKVGRRWYLFPPAGPSLDLFRFDIRRASVDEAPCADPLRECPHYSTKLQDAWLIWDALTEAGFTPTIARSTAEVTAKARVPGTQRWVKVDAADEAVVLCRLALALVEEGVWQVTQTA